MYRLLVVAALSLLFTTEALAAVSVSEVAWMGSAISANHEWIELYNDSAAVSVAGWTLSDGMNLTITLEGSIAGGTYAVLERTSDESAPGNAFFIYTGALVNTGATLTLRDAQGSIVDQVVGGSDWGNIGGDNTTKETAQYTAAGWVTDEATPGEANRQGRVEVVDTETNNVTSTSTTVTNTSSGSSRSRSQSSTVRLKNTETHMVLTTDVQSVAYVNQNVRFTASASGNYEGPESMVRYNWSFGDGYAAEGKRVEHSYQYPGEYVVVVHGRNGRTEQTARHEITVLPVTFSLSRNDRGDILIHNNAQYDVDVSDFTVRGTAAFVFPLYTIMAARGTITLPAPEIGQGNQLIALYDAKGTLITSTFASLFEQKPVTVQTPASAEPVTVHETVSTISPSFTFGATPALAAEEAVVGEVIEVAAKESGVPATPSTRTWYLLFISVFSLAFLAILFVPRTPQN